MEYIFYMLIIVLALVIWSTINERSLKKKLLVKLKEQWGMPPEGEFSAEKYESLKSYYLSIKDERLDIDDITWNDLDMDEIFLIMNNTQSSIGEEYLYSLLRKPCYSTEELKERNRLMNFFTDQEDKRILIQSKLNPIGKFNKITIYDYISRLDEQVTRSNLEHYIMILSLIASVVLIFIIPSIGGALTVLFVANNIFQYYRKKAEIENYLSVFAFICRLLDGVKEIYHLKIPEIKKYTDALKDDVDVFKKFRRGSAFVTPKQNSGSLGDMLLDYCRMLFHIDLIKLD